MNKTKQDSDKEQNSKQIAARTPLTADSQAANHNFQNPNRGSPNAVKSERRPQTTDFRTLIGRKAQIEIIGLLVIVILISLIIFFFISFEINREEDKPSQTEFSDKQLTSNIGITMLETTTCERTIRELTEDCAFKKEIMCEQGTSCQQINHTLKQILTKTLEPAGINYTLTIETANGETPIKIENGCENADNYETSMSQFQTTISPMVIKIKTCNQRN